MNTYFIVTFKTIMANHKHSKIVTTPGLPKVKSINFGMQFKYNTGLGMVKDNNIKKNYLKKYQLKIAKMILNPKVTEYQPRNNCATIRKKQNKSRLVNAKYIWQQLQSGGISATLMIYDLIPVTSSDPNCKICFKCIYSVQMEKAVKAFAN